MTEQPTWFLHLQRDLSTPVMAPDSAVIDWDQCRDRFLVPLLQRLEGRTSSPHPAIVRRLLQRRLAGEDVTDELSAAAKAAAKAAAHAADWAAWAAAHAAARAAASAAARAADWAARDADWAARAAASAAKAAASASARDAARAARAADWAAERTAQLTDLRAAIAASTQLPPEDDGIEEGIDGPERELLRVFYAATNSEGGSTDQVYLRGIRAVLAQAASGIIVPTPVQPAPPYQEALQRLLQWGGKPGCIGYSSEVVMGVVN